MDKATELATPAKIYEYVRNNFEYRLYHGARSNSVTTFMGRRGNDVDLATVLISMFRSEGMPARYVKGQIQVESAQVMNWLGVQDLDLAVSIMDSVGIQNVLLSTDRTYVEFEHVWVRVLVPYRNYRGSGPDIAAVNCDTTPAECNWIDVDPSFKQKKYKTGTIDIFDAVNFDYDAYYNAMNDSYVQPDTIDRMNKNPLEIFEEQILDYLRTNNPGKTLEDVANPGTIIPETPNLLPASLPYKVIGSPATFNSVSDHDAANDPDWLKLVTVTLTLQNSSPVVFTINLATLGVRRWSISYEDTPTGKSIVLRENGLWPATLVDIPTGTTINGIPVDENYPFSLHIEVDAVPATPSGVLEGKVISDLDSLLVGGHHVIHVGEEESNWSQFHNASQQLIDANASYPIVNRPVDGVPFVDENGDGLWDVNDTPLLDHNDAMTALTGGILYAASTLYTSRFITDMERIGALTRTVLPMKTFVAVTSSVYEVEYLDGVPFSVTPGGLFINVDARSLGPWRTGFAQTKANKVVELNLTTASSLEYEIWQELTGYDAVSTVRGIQMALADGAALVDLKKNATEDTLPASYPLFGFTNQPQSPFVLQERDIFTTRPATWSHPDNGQPEAFVVFKRSVDPGTTNEDLQGWIYDYVSQNEGPEVWASCVDFQEEQFKTWISDGQGGSTFAAPGYAFCDGSLHNGTVNDVFTQLQTNYFSFVIPSAIGQTKFDFFDENQGFVPSEHVYRQDNNIPLDWHDAGFILSVRDILYRPTAGEWNQFILASRKTSGDLYRFNVYVRKRYDVATNDIIGMTMSIENDFISANGGYVDAAEAVEQATDSTGQLFNNEVFTDQNLIANTNNNRIITPSTIDPVSTVTGNMYLDETDMALKGRGLNITFTRTYNSGPTLSNAAGLPIGYNWSHSYNMRLVANDYGDCPNCDPGTSAGQRPENGNGTTSSITYVDERGGEVNYLVDDLSATWAITNPLGVFDSLVLDSPSSGFHTITFRNGVRYVFQGPDLTVPGNDARLARIEDPYGNVLTLTYDGSGRLSNISDSVSIAGRTGLTLTYNAGSRIKDITDWTGRQWQYGYDANGNLSTITNPLGEVKTYTYHPDTNNLNEVILPEDRDGDLIGGDVATAFTYYQNNKAFNYTNRLGDAELLDYDLFRKRTRVTNPRGFVREHYYDNNGALVKLVEPDRGVMLFENTPDSLRYRKTDALGYSTTYSYRLDRTLTGSASDTGGNVTLEQGPLGFTIEYDYGLFDQITRTQDKRGNETIRTYYATTNIASGAIQGKLEKVTATLEGVPDVLLAEYQYFADGNLKRRIEYIDATNSNLKRITDYVYQDDGLNVQSITVQGYNGVTTTTDPQVTTFTYDSFGRKATETRVRRTSVTDSTPLMLTTGFTYDSLDRVKRVTDPLGNIRETVYDKNGKIAQILSHYRRPDASFDVRVEVTRVYDVADRLIQETDINGNTTTYTYDESGNRLSVTDANGHTTRFEYDAMNRQNARIDANGHRTESEFDPSGNLIAIRDANGNESRFEYDALGRQTRIITPLGFDTTLQYDGNGNVTHTTDANANGGLQPKNNQNATVYQQYDELSRLKLVRDAMNSDTLYSYNLLGDVTSITDAEGRVTTFVYDELGRLTEVRDPLIESPDKTTVFTYDELGNVLTTTDRKGQVTRSTYDVLNRVTLSEYLADGNTESRSYDIYGNLETLSNSQVTYTYTYDNQNRLKSKTDSRLGNSLAWNYDAVGNITSKTDYQNETTDYLYDSTNRLVSLRNQGYLQASYHYDPAGHLLNRILSNRAKTDYTYDANGRLLSLVNKSANGTVVQSQAYGYDRIGNINSLTDATETTNFVYDPLYRLITADYPGAANDQSYSYDTVGNRRIYTSASDSQCYQYNAGNRLVSVHTTPGQDTNGNCIGATLYQYGYDDNGSTLSKQNAASVVELDFSYDQKGRVSQITTPLQTNTFTYDPNDYRIQKIDSAGTNKYLLQAENLEATYDETNTIKAKYLRGVVVDEIINGWQYDSAGSRTNYTFHHDHLTSVTALTAHEGSTIQTTQYNPFGSTQSTIGSSSNQLSFTGREKDVDTSLYYYRARYYDPELGRFISEDPLRFQAGINFYAYVGNNPINANDPSGLEIAITGHRVGGIGPMHTAIQITPEDVARYRNDPRFVEENGRLYSTLSAGPSSLLDPTLVSDLLRSSDAPSDNIWLGEVGLPPGLTENQYIEILFRADSLYADNLNYDLFPAITPGTGFNSNGYPVGIINATGGGFPNIPSTFGGNTPIPPNSFGPVIPAFDYSLSSGFELNLNQPNLGGSFGVDPIIPAFDYSLSGGFVLYPSKPNLNTLRSVYRK